MLRVLLLLLALLPAYCAGQDSLTPPVRVLLLGSFHFGTTSDTYRTDFPDLFSPARQAELDTLAARLAAFGVDRIFVERPVAEQARYDSLYARYTNGRLTDTTVLRPEEIQIGFRLAQRAGTGGITCADVRQELSMDRMTAFDEAHAEMAEAPIFTPAYPFTDTLQRLRLHDLTLPAYYVGLNNAYHRQQRLFDYLHYAMSYVDGDDLTGAEFSAEWYARNLKIFATILNRVRAGDHTILVLFGSSHTAVLHEFFRDHPYFEVVDLETVLGG